MLPDSASSKKMTASMRLPDQHIPIGAVRYVERLCIGVGLSERRGNLTCFHVTPAPRPRGMRSLARAIRCERHTVDQPAVFQGCKFLARLGIPQADDPLAARRQDGSVR